MEWEFGFISSKKVTNIISDFHVLWLQAVRRVCVCYRVGGEGRSWTEDMNFNQFPEWIQHCISPYSP